MNEKEKRNLSLKHNLLVEKTTFEKFEENLKNSIFGVLFVLLKEEEGSVYLELVLILFELIQLMVYPFNKYVIKIFINIKFFFFNYKSQIQIFLACQCLEKRNLNRYL